MGADVSETTDKSTDNGIADNTDDKDMVDISEEIKDSKESKSTAFAPRKKKKWVKWVVILAVIALVVLYFVYKSRQASLAMLDAANNVEKAEIKRMDITSSISTTGTIQSKDVRTITSPLSGVKIDEVNYKVGDMVNEGDVLVTFSREDINKKIGQLEEDITEAKQAKNLDAGDRTNTYVNGYDSQTYSVATAYDKMLKAQEDLQKAKDELTRICNEKGDFKSDYEKAKDRIGDAKDELQKKTVSYEEWKAAGHPTATEFEEDYKKSTEIADLKTKISSYQSTIDSYDSKIDSFETSERSAQVKIDSAQRDYDTAVINYNKSGYDASFSDAKSDYTKNKGDLQANDNIKNLERQKEQSEDSLDNYIVTAPISGLVTSVNAQKGNGYQATTGALITIQAVDIFEVTTQIDEYDINSVHMGQRVLIMTDATGDEELEGIVTFIAPTATGSTSSNSSQSQSSSNGSTFEVKVDIQKKDDRLRLGMSAKLNIIKDVHNNVLAVPYDAIEEKEGGAHYVYVVDQAATASVDTPADDGGNGIQVVGIDGTNKGSTQAPDGADAFAGVSGKKEIPVQIGLEGSYYTEIISPDIKEGMMVLVNSEAGKLSNQPNIMMDGP